MMSVKKILCLFHKRDYDGKCCGALVRDYYDGQNMAGAVQLYPIDYGDPVPWDLIEAAHIIWLCDYTLAPVDMKRVAETCPNFIWIDHHAKAINECKSAQLNFPGMAGYRDTRHKGAMFSGCELTWLYTEKLKGELPTDAIFAEGPTNRVYQEQCPTVVQLFGRYDVWAEDNPKWGQYILPFQYGVRSYSALIPDNKDHYALWRTLLSADHIHVDSLLETLVVRGRIIIGYQDETNREMIRLWGFPCELVDPETQTVKPIYWPRVKGDTPLTFYALNTTYKNSLTFESLKGQYDVFVAFSHNGHNWSVSLYTFNPDLDVSAICGEYGGGGHQGAAGFISDHIMWVPLAEVDV
jgi:hypothetical protein